MSKSFSVHRRDFLRTAVAAGSAPMLAAAAPQSTQANSKIQVGMIGVGGRGSSLLRQVVSMGNPSADGDSGPRFGRGRGGNDQPAEPYPVKITAVCDVYEKRKQLAQERAKAEFATLDYREVIARKDVDAVIIATPDHWHAPIALAALDAGKDVYLEKPMTYTLHEAQELAKRVRLHKRVLQVGSQHLSDQRYHRAREVLNARARHNLDRRGPLGAADVFLDDQPLKGALIDMHLGRRCRLEIARLLKSLTGLERNPGPLRAALCLRS